ncbi:hypothetical protein LIER_17734 [Lithospermum erythrorhizon]|uniref:Uncharacterized protein n=1 Tax=Lithospermum erythrorhizon TaxID=34254 RepID=A0AAV3QBM6_LITER
MCSLCLLSDDRPAIVVTHGDLLSITDRAHVRIYLGELFGVPPHTQVFDIPESSDPVTNLSIVDMILYCLERADRNLPYKGWSLDKIRRTSRFASLFLLMLVIAVLSVITFSAVSPHIFMNNTPPPTHVDTHPPPTHVDTPPPPTHVDTPPLATNVDTTPPPTHVDWNAIRHLWLGSEYD